MDFYWYSVAREAEIKLHANATAARRAARLQKKPSARMACHFIVDSSFRSFLLLLSLRSPLFGDRYFWIRIQTHIKKKAAFSETKE